MTRGSECVRGGALGARTVRVGAVDAGEARQQVLAVGAQTVSERPSLDELEHALVQGQGVQVDDGRDAQLRSLLTAPLAALLAAARLCLACVQHLGQVPGEAEAGDVGAGVHTYGEHRARGGGVQGRRLAHGVHHLSFLDQAPLECRGQHAHAQTLGEHQLVAGARPAVVDDLAGARHAGHRQAVLGLLVIDGVPAGQLGAGFGDLLGAAAQHLGQRLQANIDRPGDQVHGRQRPGAHGVDVGERVGGRDLPEPVGVVDDGREEVDRLHQAEVVAHHGDGGVIVRLEQPRELSRGARHGAEHGPQVARAYLGRAAALGRELCEADSVGHERSLHLAGGA